MQSPLLAWLTNEELLNQLMAGLPLWGLLLIMAACVAVLSLGANKMIDGAVSLALHTGLPRMVIGATIISLGTTTPEAFVSVLAAWTGNSGLALGNGVGSIICDTGLIFGLMAVSRRVPVQRYILGRTGWVQVGAATLLVAISVAALFLGQGRPVLGRGVGAFLLVLLVLYLYMSYRWVRQSGGGRMGQDLAAEHHAGPLKSAVYIVLGLAGVLAGSRVLIPCAVEGAVRIGVPQDIIAATLVAFGTSLPELVTAISAVKKGHPQIMVGNVVGADVLNCLFVIGAAAAARPLEVPPNFFFFHYPAMLLILFSFRVFISLDRDGWFRRWQGAWMLGVYLLYVVLQYTLGLGG
ncbi:MAG: sodium:calcium antiporter [Desulfarculus sp.]|jgi:cation:H+ antiporter|nr:MAG: sodium:calcium antiporter [Desulfarculus sp.]